jgi:hypothetical protein
MKELNKKMLKFAGFRRATWSEPHEDVYVLVEPNSGGMSHCWVNFPNDLNACFKWLVPKLQREDRNIIQIQFDPPNDDNETYWARIYYEVPLEGTKGSWSEDIVESKNETPALALCRAIEKLIGD